MNKGLLTLIAIALLATTPMASAAVHAGFVGFVENNGRTKMTTYSLSGNHWADAVGAPDIGDGSFYVGSLFFGGCVFTTMHSCISGTFGETLFAGDCGYELTAKSRSALLGGSDTKTRTVCNPF